MSLQLAFDEHFVNAPEAASALFAEGRQIAGVRFNFLSYEQVGERIEEWRRRARCGCIQTVNPHSVMLCAGDPAMRRATEQAALTLPDGVGITLAARLLGYPHQGRVTGPLLMLHLCDWGRRHGWRHYFYGGAAGTAEELARRFTEALPGIAIAGASSPPFRPLTAEEDEHAVETINAAGADIVWVGLGAPKQEKWMAGRLGRLQATALIGVGAAFDFHSGNIPWAPALIRRCGVEWAWRLALEPRRMWPRNVNSVRFLLRVLRQRLTLSEAKGPGTS